MVVTFCSAVMLLGLAIFAVGWVLNTCTPYQQRLPVLGAVLFVVGGILLGLLK